MIQTTWHLTTVAFLSAGAGLLLSGAVLHGDIARGMGLLAAGASTGFAGVTVGLGIASVGTPRALLRHPAPLLLTVIAALAWWGSV
jgi:hypothetical protein